MSCDPGKPRTWIPFKASLCESCVASCCHDMPVEVSVADLIRLGVLTEEEASTSLSKAARRLKREGVIQVFRAPSLVFVLQQKPNKDCLYLDKNRRCTVYEKRPTICREFPKDRPSAEPLPLRA